MLFRSRNALFLSTVDMIFAAILAGDVEPDKMQAVAHWLDAIAAAAAKGRGRPARPANLPEGTRLVAYIDRVVDGVWPGTEAPRRPKQKSHHRAASVSWPNLSQSVQVLAARLVLGRDVVVSALQLALCLGIAFVAQDVLGGVRSYWIPLCVVIVLKPDFGSVFVRAVQRSLGTILGVAIGIVLLTFVPKGLWLLACMAALATLIPPAAQRGYAAQCAVLTPLVLILIDMTVPGITVDFGPERLVDTLVGSAIVLVFGYLIWPRDPDTQIQASFNQAIQVTAAYLRAAGAPMPADAGQLPATQTALFSATMAAYRSLSNVRTSLQRALAEPPPASRKAAAWFPAVVEAERLCDGITKLAHLNLAGAVTLDPADVERRVARLASIRGEEPATSAPMDDSGPSAAPEEEPAFHEIDLELDQLARLMEPAGAPAK